MSDTDFSMEGRLSGYFGKDMGVALVYMRVCDTTTYQNHR